MYEAKWENVSFYSFQMTSPSCFIIGFSSLLLLEHVLMVARGFFANVSCIKKVSSWLLLFEENECKMLLLK